MADLSILILDDDELWLARHERRLMQAGFKCRSTQLAKEAIGIARTDPSIKFALIDEILFVPPIPVEEKKRELQRWQGSGVVREIAAHRSDVQVIIVTSAPQLRSGGDSQVFSRETSKLRRQRGVIDIIHKQDIEDDPDREYNWLLSLLRKPRSSTTDQVAMPRILVGLGLPHEIFEQYLAQYRERYRKECRRKQIPLRDYLKDYGYSEYELNSALTKHFPQIQSVALARTVFVEMPGSRKLDRCSTIKPDSSGFQILMILALRAEKRESIVIRKEDYQYSPRKSSTETYAAPDLDPRVIRDFVFEYGEDGGKHLRKGVQVEPSSERNSPLKTQISRLRKQLASLNVGPARYLFEDTEQGGYRPSFEIGIILYPATKTKKGTVINPHP